MIIAFPFDEIEQTLQRYLESRISSTLHFDSDSTMTSGGLTVEDGGDSGLWKDDTVQEVRHEIHRRLSWTQGVVIGMPGYQFIR